MSKHLAQAAQADAAMPRRRALAALGLAATAVGMGVGSLPAPAQAAGRVKLALAQSLPAELAAALAHKQPLLVMVSLAGCPFCMQVRDSYLGPLRDEQGQRMVQVDMRSNAPVVRFDGQRSTHDELTRAWAISIAPTLLFFGPQGRELAPRLLGSTLPDFYGAYLAQRLLQAQAAL